MTRSRSALRFNRSVARTGLLVIVVACAQAIAAPAEAQATTSFGQAVTYWRQVQGHTYTNWEQDITFVESGESVSAEIFGTMFYGPWWYIQVDTWPEWGQSRLMFSMPQASGVQPGPGAICETPDWGGACWLQLNEVLIGKTVRIFLIKSNRTDGTDLWWSLWALIGNRGFYIGQLRTPYQGAINQARNRSGAMGGQIEGDPMVFCTSPPQRTTVVYGPPTVSSPVLPPRKLLYSSGSTAGCRGPGSISAPFYDGAVHVLGP